MQSPSVIAKQMQSIEVIVFCLKKRFSGVTATIDQLMPHLAECGQMAYVGPLLPHQADKQNRPQYPTLRFRDALMLSRHRLKDGRKRIWHLRRNKEMLLGMLFRDVFRLPVQLVFTSAAIKKHSLFPRWLISRMDAVIATSDEAAKPLSNCNSIVPHGIDINRFCLPSSFHQTKDENASIQGFLTMKQNAWQTTGLPGKYGIGIYGRVREEKGIHLFVSSMIAFLPSNPDFTAFIAGLCVPADKKYKQNLIRAIDKAGLSERIVFIGDVKSEDMPFWYQSSLVAIACPLYEGFGLTVLESMACGCAVIATRTGAFASMIAPGETGELIELNSSHALTSALNNITNQIDKAAGMGLKARQRVESLFAIEKEAKGIYENYQQLWASDLGK